MTQPSCATLVKHQIDLAGHQMLAAFLLGAMICVGPAQAFAPDNPPILCEQAAKNASAESGVPLDVLRAIALTETGQSRGSGEQPSPWPWAINRGGAASRFGRQDEAAQYARQVLATGDLNLDLGCFQLNYRWHSAAFGSIEDMLDPAQNASYAAQLLRGHHDRLGDWSLAAGAYHSATPEFAERYRLRFDRIYAGVATTTSDGPQLALLSPRVNSFPLLRPGGRGTGPSLFPAVSTGRRLIGD